MKSEKRNADWNLIACAAVIGAIAPIAVLATLWFIGLESKA
ncbi:hypothetical protein [Puniceibacterium sediminis]|uniref:Uncharacterized protein n=1 Tax=Puniceibacterium sediminis TaxID=1608407 RepID=A0A238VLE1_9RHOB|nr:hypothetical protein [Puniceibacterium sediminis]SNR35192.1 hypothetical protein SAMN06265370_102357 [Puniceibacterium sediminis]